MLLPDCDAGDRLGVVLLATMLEEVSIRPPEYVLLEECVSTEFVKFGHRPQHSVRIGEKGERHQFDYLCVTPNGRVLDE